jgi:hypothetical protein
MKKNQNEIRYSDLPVYEIEVDEEGNQGIRMISLVADPAISVMGMYFSSDIEKEYTFKSIQDKQIIVGPAMLPEKKILRKDDNGNYYYVYFTKETIKKMVDKFLKDNNNRALNIDHSNKMVPGFIQGAWIIEDPVYDKSRYYGFNLPAGTFFIEVKIEDKDFWLSEVKDEGRYGFSIEGMLSQKLVQMEKVSFDFDGTLSQEKVKEIAKEKIANGDDVYIITKRSEDDYVKNIAKEIGIKASNVIFTNHEPKWSFVKKLGIDTHYDNVEAEVNEIKDKTNANVIKVSSPVNYSNVIVDAPKYIDELIDDLKEEELEELLECFQESYDDYPKAATENAKIALRWAEENGWGSCGTPVGKARANQLAKGEPITRNTIARMAAFERHRQNSQKELGDGCGRLMWLAWGGDEGVAWAQRKLKQIDNKEFVVEPKSGESKDEFVSRCIGVEINAGKPEDQAAAICYAKWENK